MTKIVMGMLWKIKMRWQRVYWGRSFWVEIKAEFWMTGRATFMKMDAKVCYIGKNLVCLRSWRKASVPRVQWARGIRYEMKLEREGEARSCRPCKDFSPSSSVFFVFFFNCKIHVKFTILTIFGGIQFRGTKLCPLWYSHACHPSLEPRLWLWVMGDMSGRF